MNQSSSLVFFLSQYNSYNAIILKTNSRFYELIILNALRLLQLTKLQMINKSFYLSVEEFSTTLLLGNTETSKQILKIEQKLVTNPNWREDDQLAIYKA